MESWKTEELAKTYLEGVRAAIPFAKEQIEILLRLAKTFTPAMETFLDLGCGDGILGRTNLSAWPQSKGVFLDYSGPMISAAKIKCAGYGGRATFVTHDFGKSGWLNSLKDFIPVDLVISGFSIHHQPDDVKRRLFKDIFDKVLKPGGLFLDLDQTASPSKDIERIFDGFFLDSVEKSFGGSPFVPMSKIKEEYYNDKKVNMLASVEDQCGWLRETGFVNVDCYFKVFEMAVFGGVKPE